MKIDQVSVETLRQRLQSEEEMFLLDVREPFEVEYASIEGAISIPMGEIPHRLEEIPRDCPIFVLCHHGIRSQQVAQWLSSQGIAPLHNVVGGIDAWSLEIDSEVPRYR